MDKLKPSQLLRLGAKQVPQIEGDYFVKDQQGKIVGACAIGLMTIAKAGSLDIPTRVGNIKEVYPLGQMINELNLEYKINIDEIVDMNDTDGKTAEEIARWLESKGA